MSSLHIALDKLTRLLNNSKPPMIPDDIILNKSFIKEISTNLPVKHRHYCEIIFQQIDLGSKLLIISFWVFYQLRPKYRVQKLDPQVPPNISLGAISKTVTVS
jgi:hypothetical protein